MLKEKGFYKGVNFGGWLSQCSYEKEHLDNFITEKDFATVSEWGLDHVRIPFDYNIIEKDGEFIEDGFGYLDNAVQWCEKYGLNLVLDLHKTAGFSFDYYAENENGFFSEENLRYIHLFMNYMTRRQSTATSLRDYTIQVRDLHNTQLEVRQNKTMTLLTVITTIFMPLTLIAGWYGMNFRYMPELQWRYGYLAVFVLSLAVIVFCLNLFKKKKWL